ncbi:MAG: hypothetical protein ACLGHW_08570 [Gammaproteobacteria bacterium]
MDRYDLPPDPALRPTWRLLWARIRALHDAHTGRRAERLVLRAMIRDWEPAALEALLARLEARARAAPVARADPRHLPRHVRPGPRRR